MPQSLSLSFCILYEKNSQSLTLPLGWQSIRVSQNENGPPSGSLLLRFQTWSKKKQEQFHINHEHKSWLPIHNIPPQKASKTVDLNLWS